MSIRLTARRFQHPLRDSFTIPLRFTEPPSEVGTGGGQIVEAWLGAVAVVIADWFEVSGISPGNNEGA
jgi:hypothetical protein